jgi:hypothetical protein
MNTYKITNITNQLNKRESQYNSNVDIQYVDNMIKKTITVKPGETVYLSIDKLPTSIHKLKMKNFIIVLFMDTVELEHLIDKSKAKTVEIPEIVEQPIITKKRNKKENESK